MSEIVVVGLSHKTAPIEIREKLSFSEHQVKEGLAHLKCYPGVQEGLIVSTCNRVEVYAVTQEAGDGFQELHRFLANHGPDLSEEAISKALYFYAGRDAVGHLYRVASSLDSMMVGEPQILGQVKEAFEIAMQQSATGVILNKLFKKAISVAKRVRTETKIAEQAVSISFAAVELAKKIFGPLDQQDHEVLLIGAGEMAELAVRHFVTAGAQRVTITTRNYENAVELAKQFEGRPIPFEDFPKELEKADIVLCSTGAAHHIVRKNHLTQAITRRLNRPIFLIDISVPRNIDPSINEIDNVYLYDIDDLQSVVEANLQQRQSEALIASEIVNEEIEAVLKWMKSLDAVPTITALRDRAEEIRRTELERALAKLDRLTPQEREAVEALAASIINKILHSPLITLKAEAHSTDGMLYLDAARRLFGLDDPIAKRRTKKKDGAGGSESE